MLVYGNTSRVHFRKNSIYLPCNTLSLSFFLTLGDAKMGNGRKNTHINEPLNCDGDFRKDALKLQVCFHHDLHPARNGPKVPNLAR